MVFDDLFAAINDHVVIIIHVHSIPLYDKIWLMVLKALHILKLILRAFNKLVKIVLVVCSYHVCRSKE